MALTERNLRLGTDKISLDCVIIALLLGGEIGIGTIVCTFGLGPVIDLFHQIILKILKQNSVELQAPTAV